MHNIFNNFLILVLCFWMMGCATVFPKWNQSESKTSPKQELIRHVINPRQYVGRYYSPIEGASPLIIGDVIFQGCTQDGFLAINKHSGKNIWHTRISGGVESKATFYDDKVYFGANDGHFYALNAKTGKVIWKYNTKVEILSTPIVKGGIVYFSTANNGLYALKASSGKWVWYFNKGYIQKISVRGSSSPVYHDGKIYVGFSDGYFYAFNAFDGKAIWFKRLAKESKFIDVDVTPIASQRDIIVGSYDGSIYSLNPNTGKVDWRIQTDGVRGLVLEDDTIYATTIGGMVGAFNRKNGAKVWESHIKKGTPSAPILVEDQIIFSTSEKYVYSYATEDGAQIWRYSTASGVSAAPTFDQDKVYLFSNFSALHVIDPFYLLFDN